MQSSSAASIPKRQETTTRDLFRAKPVWEWRRVHQLDTGVSENEDASYDNARRLRRLIEESRHACAPQPVVEPTTNLCGAHLSTLIIGGSHEHCVAPNAIANYQKCKDKKHTMTAPHH